MSRLRSPEQLDRSIRITSSRSWVALLLLALVTTAVLGWSLFGTLDTQVSGLGIVLPDGGKVFTVSSQRGGTVKSIKVRTGSRVSAGDALVVLRDDSDESDLTAARRDLRALRKQYQSALSQSEALITERTKTNKDLIANYQRKIDTMSKRLGEKTKAFAGLNDDLKQGYVTRDTVDSARSEIDNLRFQIADNREKIADARVQLAEFVANQRTAMADQDWTIRKQEIDFQRMSSRKHEDEVLRASDDGIVSEVAVGIGDQLTSGQHAVSILTGDPDLMVEGFFRAADGKRIVPGMRALVVLSSAQPSVYGTAIGKVVDVSELPVTSAFINDMVGNQELTREMVSDGAPIYVRVRLVRDPSTPSGLAWSSSKGPPFRVAAGTVASPTVTVASQPPINFVAPIMPQRVGLARSGMQ